MKKDLGSYREVHMTAECVDTSDHVETYYMCVTIYIYDLMMASYLLGNQVCFGDMFTFYLRRCLKHLFVLKTWIE